MGNVRWLSYRSYCSFVGLGREREGLVMGRVVFEGFRIFFKD